MNDSARAPDLEHIPFRNAAASARCIERLLGHEVPGFAAQLAASLQRASSPDRLVMGLDRYLDACGDKAVDELTRMTEAPNYLRMIAIALSQSSFLTDILCCHPEYAHWLWTDARLDRARSPEEMRGDIEAGKAGALEDFAACCKALREFRKREMLRIAVREMDKHAPMESVTEDLSNLADAAMETAIRSAWHSLEARFGAPEGNDGKTASFTILGMGKLGGRELNFSSDIDLLFFYSNEGKTSAQKTPQSRSISNGEFFSKLGEWVIKALQEPTVDGALFRVDMRLRPHGRDGALAVTIDSAVDYYVNYGRAWERQALIKARPCAGCKALGAEFLERMRPFVYPKYFDDETLEDIRQTKRQLEASIELQGVSEREVKLGRGGIRDIEFTVQMLQLVNGGRAPELRMPNTIEAIEALGKHGEFGPLEAAALRTHYIFLRQAEHRLQVEGGQQVHALPEDPEALDEFARRLGFAGAEAYMAVYRERTEEIRGILERFLALKGAGHLWLTDLLNTRSDAARSLPQLAEMGFGQPERAREELLLLAYGSKSRPHGVHVGQRFNEIAPFLLKSISCTRHPDAVLLRLGQILQKINAPGTIYELLKQTPELCHFLVTLVSNSEYLCNILMRDPGLLDTVSSVDRIGVAADRDELTVLLLALEGAYQSDSALYRLRDGEMLRIGMRELVLHATVAEVGDDLTLLAEVILERALQHAQDARAARHGDTEIRFAVLGLGKFGGLEMGYGSDLDLLFVYESEGKTDSGMGAAEYFSGVASRVTKQLKEATRYGVLYDVDTRLRPDGSKGMLATSLARLEAYFSAEAEPWERFALMKVRAVAGDAVFAAEAERRMKEVAYCAPLDPPALDRIDELRRRHVEAVTNLDLKKYQGGINEIEFIVRFWQHRNVAAHPELKRGDVFGAMDTLEKCALADPEACALVRRAYARLRRVLNRVRMWDGGAATALPTDADTRADLAHRLGIDEDLVTYVDRYRGAISALYAQTFDEARALSQKPTP